MPLVLFLQFYAFSYYFHLLLYLSNVKNSFVEKAAVLQSLCFKNNQADDTQVLSSGRIFFKSADTINHIEVFMNQSQNFGKLIFDYEHQP